MSRIALVTGGTRGIGKEIALELKNNGFKVITTYISNEEAAKQFQDEFGIEAFKWNVAEFEQCQLHINQIVTKYGKHPEILVNNAGITRDRMLHKSTYQDWDEVLKTNLYSCFNMCHALIPHMREHGFGRIVNISSINGVKGQMGQVNYSAAKAGILGFTKALALENANKNITVNAIAPGYIETDMTSQMKPEVLNSIKQGIPVGKMGSPADIARCVLFLAADEANFITGTTINVNGGQHM
ncbi:acetoacetyl-CoA reductase [Rickettsiales endosymbiont of Stachyamoeba lipophora]|uniref:acetoacetyl-CoA reductase n=1 Tax=Rickettsiales endosymbiont of Stachyamoeba lipophora TaxID=2486578 RepID=UPI000F64C90D|nr:acetoacetyl-CoA reductase [Rickettsiales endosymbiont of Stachyamoeba lipophora]AZL15292.1 acetoacetyl-CoA reductase [Rickettsiales endosymbiont of Stachyamoeba lipophora]